MFYTFRNLSRTFADILEVSTIMNNQETIAETRRYILKRRFRCRRCRPSYFASPKVASITPGTSFPGCINKLLAVKLAP